MRRHLLDLIILFVFASLAAGYVVAAQPAARNVTLHVYVFVVGGLVMLGVDEAALQAPGWPPNLQPFGAVRAGKTCPAFSSALLNLRWRRSPRGE